MSGYVSGDYLELSASRPQSGGDTSSDGGSSGGSGDLPSGGDAGTVSGSASDLVALAQMCIRDRAMLMENTVSASRRRQRKED